MKNKKNVITLIFIIALIVWALVREYHFSGTLPIHTLTLATISLVLMIDKFRQ